jgi:O-antigen/teichoic acid export membrane protein
MDNNLSLEEIKARVKKSFLGLVGRRILLRIIGFVTINLILAKVLSLETLGIFNIATAIITFFAFFSDIGLAGSLIQKSKEIKEEDIATTFTIQQLLVGSITAIIIIFAPFLSDYYRMGLDGIWLIRALAVAFFLTSLKVVPSVMLERNLKFAPLVWVEIIETLTFNGLLIYLVFQGYGLNSFSLAVIARGIVGTVGIYLVAPVKVRINIHRDSLRELANFGIPYQLNSILALVKDRLVPLVVARMVGSEQFTYITWSQAMAMLPLDILSEVNRLTFPAFSRLQDDKKSLSLAIEKTLFVSVVIIYPLLFGLAAILPSLINHIVTAKFSPALFSFYLFSASAFWAVISTIFTNVLNAIGRVKTTMKLMVFWTVITWVLTPILVYFYGFIGVGLSSFLISFTSVITIILVKRVLAVRVTDAIFIPTLCSVLMGFVVYAYSHYIVRDWLTLISAIILGGAVYTTLILLFAKDRVLNSLQGLRNG